MAIAAIGGAAALAGPEIPAAAQCQLDRLANPDPSSDDWFGRSVDVSGDTAVVGVLRDDDQGSESGSAYIFRADGASWVEVVKIVAADGQTDDWFGWSSSIDGDTVAIAAEQDDDAGDGAGAVYIHERDLGGPDAWGLVLKLTAPDADDQDRFGVSVSLSGDTLAVGAYQNDDHGTNSGSVYVFGRDVGGPDAWGLIRKVTADDADAEDKFGWSVSLDGDTLLVGAYQDDDEGPFTGSAYILARNQGGLDAWGQVQKIVPAVPINGGTFGVATDLHGDLAVVGANATATGIAYVFRRDLGGADAWGQVTPLLSDDAAVDDLFGNSVAVHGDRIVVGAPLDDDNGMSAGSAYVFEQTAPDVWTQVDKIQSNDIAASDFFGATAGMDGGTVIIGAYRDDDAVANEGSAYVFSLDGVGCVSCDGDVNVDFAVDVEDLVALILAWGTADPAADVDGDGIVAVPDLVALVLAWGPC